MNDIITSNVSNEAVNSRFCKGAVSGSASFVLGWFSSTTAKHINSFLNYFGFKTCCKKELENYGK